MLLIYCSAEDLLANLGAVNPSTPVYIDLRLANAQMQGLELAEVLHRRGFRDLYLSTGISSDECPVPDIIKGVRGKNPPWTP